MRHDKATTGTTVCVYVCTDAMRLLGELIGTTLVRGLFNVCGAAAAATSGCNRVGGGTGGINGRNRSSRTGSRVRCARSRDLLTRAIACVCVRLFV